MFTRRLSCARARVAARIPTGKQRHVFLSIIGVFRRSVRKRTSGEHTLMTVCLHADAESSASVMMMMVVVVVMSGDDQAEMSPVIARWWYNKRITVRQNDTPRLVYMPHYTNRSQLHTRVGRGHIFWNLTQHNLTQRSIYLTQPIALSIPAGN